MVRHGKTLWDGYDILLRIAKQKSNYRYAILLKDLCVYPASVFTVVRLVDGFLYFVKANSYEDALSKVSKYNVSNCKIELYDLSVKHLKLEKYTVSYDLHSNRIILLINKKLLKFQVNKTIKALSNKAKSENLYVHILNSHIDRLKMLINSSYVDSRTKRNIQVKIRRKFIHNFASMYKHSKRHAIKVYKTKVKKLYYED